MDGGGVLSKVLTAASFSMTASSYSVVISSAFVGQTSSHCWQKRQLPRSILRPSHLGPSPPTSVIAKEKQTLAHRPRAHLSPS